MSWKKKMTHRDAKPVVAEVNGEKINFYPNRMALLFQVTSLSEKVAKSMAALFADQDRDSAQVVKTHAEDGKGDSGAYQYQEIATEAVGLETIQYREQQRSQAIADLVNVIADGQNQRLLGLLLMDSMRDEFPYNPDRHPSEVEEFLYGDPDDESGYAGLDTPTLVACFKGWMKANSQVFGDVGEQMVGLVRSKMELVPADSQSAEETDPTNGSSSNKPSSKPSDTDSQPST